MNGQSLLPTPRVRNGNREPVDTLSRKRSIKSPRPLCFADSRKIFSSLSYLREKNCYSFVVLPNVNANSTNVLRALTVLTNLRKLCCHPSLLEKNNQGANDLALSGKLKVLDALLQATKQCNPDDKVVIVSNFTSVLSTIEETIFKARKWPYVRLDGTVAQSDRQPLVDSFNRCSPDKAFAFLLSSKAGGCGLNLIGGEFRNCCG